MEVPVVVDHQMEMLQIDPGTVQEVKMDNNSTRQQQHEHHYLIRVIGKFD